MVERSRWSPAVAEEGVGDARDLQHWVDDYLPNEKPGRIALLHNRQRQRQQLPLCGVSYSGMLGWYDVYVGKLVYGRRVSSSEAAGAVGKIAAPSPSLVIITS